jgi:glycosyltransferase involved in cell wall biosynthesis
MYCGGCFRDNALVAALRRLGHDTLMVPLYLPLTLDDADQSKGTPVFFSGLNVYLEQRSAFFRRAPQWLNRMMSGRLLLKALGRSAAKTRPAEAGEMTLSMLRGEDGYQARELEALIAWLKSQVKPDVICLSNALLIGMVRRLRTELSAPVVCTLQGEDGFLDGLPPGQSAAGWQLLRERATEVDLFISPSQFYSAVMRARLELPAEKVRVIRNGIDLTGFAPAANPPRPPVLGFFARLCREKGLDILIDAYVLLRRRNRIPRLGLRIGGSLGPADEPLVQLLRSQLEKEGFLSEMELCPNLSRAEKQAFYRSLSVMSVPVRYGEAFGLYVLEALASGVPVVQPRSGAFPELMETTGGGLLCEPGDPQSLAETIEQLLLQPGQREAMARQGLESVRHHFSIERMAEELVMVYRQLTGEV